MKCLVFVALFVLSLIDYFEAVVTLSRQSVPNRLLFERVHRQHNWYDDVTDNSYVIASDHMPINPNYYPTVANGYLGHVVFRDYLLMNGLYNGKTGKSHKAKVPIKTPKIFPLTVENNYILDMSTNTFKHTSKHEGKIITVSSFAHSVLTRLLVFEISDSSGFDTKHDLQLNSVTDRFSYDDVNIVNSTSFKFNFSSCEECKYLYTATATFAQTKEAEEDFSKPQNVVILSSDIPAVIPFPRRETGANTSYFFFISVASTLEEAMMFYEAGLKSAAANSLYSSHCQTWAKTWQNSSISVKGDPVLDQAIKASLFYLQTSFPPPDMEKNYPFDFLGAGPGGAAHGVAGKDYQGHVFWDQDFWMVPGLLPLFPDVAKEVLDYRGKNLPGALMKAKNLGWMGAAYPWETGFTGADVCPGMEYITNEIHVTGDIIYLLRQYVYLTNNWNFLTQKMPTFSCSRNFSTISTSSLSCEPIMISDYSQCYDVTPWDMLRETATFWQNKARWNVTVNSFVINGVMGPDEYHSPVNNSAFTNVIASLTLNFASEVATRFGVCPDLIAAWMNVSDQLLVPFDHINQYHPEFDGFDFTKDVVKQADTIMLGFPLNVNVSDQVRRNDLTIYEKTTTSQGPAMTWGMFAINWLELSEESKAAPMFLRQMENIQQPFKVWSENANGQGAVNFLTGMGGFIQSIVYGYFGLRFNDTALTFTAFLLPKSNASVVDEMTLNGIHFHGFIIDVMINKTSMTVTHVSNHNLETNLPACLQVHVVSDDKKHNLCFPNQSVVVPRTKIEITVSKQAWFNRKNKEISILR